MNFEDILADMEGLVNKELAPINPKTGSITIVYIDRTQESYSVKPAKGRAIKRSFAELQKIWEQLRIQRAINVEVVLEGAGSSRHHPETILAYLPYVDYFKFRNKKHLYLQDDATHELGTINQLSGPLLREAKRVLDSLDKFNRHGFSAQFKASLSTLKEAVEKISVKYPGELHSSNLNKSIEELNRLHEVIQGTIIDPDDYSGEVSNYGGDDTGLESSHEDKDSDDEGLGEPFGLDEKDKELSAARIRHVTPMFSLLFDRMRYEEIELQPNFQRRDRIWKAKDKSALIESILIGLPIPNLYFAERKNGNWVVIDGLQRLTTLKDYMEGDFVLSELSILEDLQGLAFNDLSRHYQRKFREYTLHCHIISITNNDDDLVKALFQRINTYGVRLSYQEIRCALYVGTSVPFIRYIAESDEFRRSTFAKINYKRMKDMEHVLGVVAFILFGYDDYNYNRFDKFLGAAMQELNKFKLNISGDFLTSQDENLGSLISPEWDEQGTAQIYNELKQKIENAFSLTEEVFGDERYQKSPDGKIVISKPLFELIVSVFASLTKEQSDILVAKKEMVKTEFRNLLENERDIEHDWESETYIDADRGFEYSVSQSTGKRVTILYRFKNFVSLLEDVIGKPIKMNAVLNRYADWDSEKKIWLVKDKYADQRKA